MYIVLPPRAGHALKAAFCATAVFFMAAGALAVANPEMRAMWVSRFEWPSSSEATAKSNIDTIMQTIAANNFNTVLFQVRGQCDVHYPSPYEPWSNTYNWTNPGWDPLAYAIQKAHENGLEFHAYINTHTLAAPVPPANTVPQHKYNLHGPSVPPAQSWMIRTSPTAAAGLVDSYYWISPGIPEASAWTRQAIMHVVKNYDVDGVHFDRIRCPSPSYSHDPVTEARFAGDANPDGLNFADFMRSQITRDLRNIYGEIAYHKPNVKTSAAPFGIVYKDATTNYQGTGTQSYHQWYQDSWGWLNSHVLDFMVPQIYWQVGSSHPFELLLQDWMERRGDRHVVAGSTTNSGAKTVSALLDEHAQTRLQNAHGHTVFSYSSMGAYWNSFLTQRYQEPALLPDMPWKSAPTSGIITGYVVDMNGSPVVDAKVKRAGDSYNYLSAHDGFFSILDVPPGSSHSLTGTKSNVGERTVGSISVTAGNVTSVTLVLKLSRGAISLDRNKYPPGGTAEVAVLDGDLAGQPTVAVLLSSTSETTSETILLPADGPAGIFRGNVPLATGSVVPADGIIQVQDGDLLLASYFDTDDGTSNSATVVDSAQIDGTGPVISNVTTSSLFGGSVIISFNTDEPATATVRFGTSCEALTQQSAVGSLNTTHTISLGGLTPDTTYYYRVEAADEAGNLSTNDNGGTCFQFILVQPDYLTEQFTGDNDLDNKTIKFTPNSSSSFYGACSDAAAAYPTDPAGGTSLALPDDGAALVTLTGGAQIYLYGTAYSSFYVNSNGNITFGSGDSDYTEDLSKHFSTARISALYDDLNPGAGGAVSWKQSIDKVAVTFNLVPEYGLSSTNSFQYELFFDGRIHLTYLAIAATDGIAGLSQGFGLPVGFVENDLSSYIACLNLAPVIAISPELFNLRLEPNTVETTSLVVRNEAAAGAVGLQFIVQTAATMTTTAVQTVGTGALAAAGNNRYRGCIYEATENGILKKIEPRLEFSGNLSLNYVVFESSTTSGTYNSIYNGNVSHTGAGSTFYSSGNITVPLTAGRFYIVAVGWTGATVTYPYSSDALPANYAFGVQRNGYGIDSYPLGATASNANNMNTYQQRITVEKSWLSGSPATIAASVAPQSAGTALLTVATYELTDGFYSGSATVISNDPENQYTTATVNLEVKSRPSAVNNPFPPDGATNLPPTFTLTWNPAAGADSYNFYLGTSNPPPFVSNLISTQAEAANLNPGTTYYWRVDSVNVMGETSGTVYSFSTAAASQVIDWYLY
ncbi:MAG: family 10 glycosylhydrolase [Candidatus Sumerlaeaceae bacterium]